MQIVNGDIYWQQKEKIRHIYPYLTYDANCDVLVIGGGITGALTAYYLAKEGINVIVVEKNIIGYSTTSASTALLDYSIDTDLIKLEKIIGENQARRIYKLCFDAIKDLEKINKEFDSDTEFSKKDSLYFDNHFMSKNNMEKECEKRKQVGFDTKYVNSSNILNMNSGILTKSSSAILNPYKFTQELFIYLSKFENVRIYENTNIEEVYPKYDYVECYTNNNFLINANKVIFATGVETLKYIQKIPAQVYKTFTVVTKPVAELKAFKTNFTAKEAGEPNHYIRFTNDSRIMYEGEQTRYSDKMNNDKYLIELANSRYKKLYGSLCKTFDNFENIAVDFAFNSTNAISKDGLPIIDEIDNMPNCFCNLGYGADGILYSTIGANILKDAVKGYYTKDMNMFKINR